MEAALLVVLTAVSGSVVQCQYHRHATIVPRDTGRVHQPKIAQEITHTISTPARRALVETLDSNSV